ncbi:MAG: hypothetical protein ABSG03_24365, partial [Bryobacteraceae bacterium]
MLTIGAPIGSPLTTGATVSGASVVYFVADQATGIKLPAATTAGQQLIFIGNAPTNANSGFTLQAPSGELINVGSTSNSANTFRALDAVHLISDGNGI